MFGSFAKTLYLCTRFRERTPAEGSATWLSSEGRLAQLVQSICLTSRGSAVRIRQRPHDGSLAQLNRASDYGSEGCGFESRRSHFFDLLESGRIPEWPNGADCKSAGCYLRWFESISAHTKQSFAAIAQLVEHDLAKVGVASSSLVCRSH